MNNKQLFCFFFLAFLLTVRLSASDYYDLLHAPRAFTQEEIIEHKKMAEIGMVFNIFYEGSSFISLAFFNTGNVSQVGIICDKELFTTLSADQQLLFKDFENSEKSTLFGCIREEGGFTSSVDSLSQYSGTQMPETRGVCVPRRYFTENSAIEKMSLEQLTQIIKNKKTVFYTGAGISAGLVPTMNEFCDELGTKEWSQYKKEEPAALVQLVMDKSPYYLHYMRDFFRRCIESNPSPAHEALAALSKKYNSAMITENVDSLHQKTGIDVITRGSDLLQKINVEQLRHVDAIICIGLAHDAIGLLHLYKQHKPTGSIIAVDLGVPSYLGNNDYLVQGDIQEIVPQLDNY